MSETQQGMPDDHGFSLAIVDGRESHASYRAIARMFRTIIHSEQGDAFSITTGR